ncbi:hypothetical protein NHX12_024594 [Muraenolepis orangiensis]|uniref:Uncharacterized protein n=1 Tax=Muraenolepis orangiensis TaxID=630683 RepID=A0A9Q0IRG5_9TELE|nr:hypothetical protein NHX12_024594 [Muraenolepis orangiensis]
MFSTPKYTELNVEECSSSSTTSSTVSNLLIFRNHSSQSHRETLSLYGSDSSYKGLANSGVFSLTSDQDDDDDAQFDSKQPFTCAVCFCTF